VVARHRGAFEEVEELCAESLAFYRELRDPYGVALNLLLLGAISASQGRFARAEPLLSESLTL